jgi:hypothetical protein
MTATLKPTHDNTAFTDQAGRGIDLAGVFLLACHAPILSLKSPPFIMDKTAYTLFLAHRLQHDTAVEGVVRSSFAPADEEDMANDMIHARHGLVDYTHLVTEQPDIISKGSLLMRRFNPQADCADGPWLALTPAQNRLQNMQRVFVSAHNGKCVPIVSTNHPTRFQKKVLGLFKEEMPCAQYNAQLDDIYAQKRLETPSLSDRCQKISRQLESYLLSYLR